MAVGTLVSGGNVRGAVPLNKSNLFQLPTPKPLGRHPLYRGFLIALIADAAVFLISTVLAAIAGHPQAQYHESSSSTGYLAYFSEGNPLASYVGIFLPIAIVAGVGIAVLLTLVIAARETRVGELGESIGDASPWIFFGLVGAGVVFLAIVIPLSVTGTYANTDYMNERANNWIVNNLNIPLVMNYAENAETNTDYAEYNEAHKLVKFKIESTTTYIKITPKTAGQ